MDLKLKHILLCLLFYLGIMIVMQGIYDFQISDTHSSYEPCQAEKYFTSCSEFDSNRNYYQNVSQYYVHDINKNSGKLGLGDLLYKILIVMILSVPIYSLYFIKTVKNKWKALKYLCMTLLLVLIYTVFYNAVPSLIGQEQKHYQPYWENWDSSVYKD